MEETSGTDERAHWMGILARAEEQQLLACVKDINMPSYNLLLGPEQGLVMVRGRAGEGGRQFNLGEMTVTRCSVQVLDGAIGHSYVAGRSKEKAEIAAVLDALLQDDRCRDDIYRSVISPIAEQEEKKRQQVQAKSASTKVDFISMVRGE